MKIKSNFVTNSSSVSFCVWGTHLDFCDITRDIAEKLYNYVGAKNNFELYLKNKNSQYDDLREFCHNNDLDFTARGNMFCISYVIIGKSPEKMKGNQTLDEFKEEIRDIFKIIGIETEPIFVLTSWEDR